MSAVQIAIVISVLAGIGGGLQAAVSGALGRRIGVDAFGLFGFEPVPLTLTRLAGLVLLAAGAVLVLRR